MQIGKQNNPQRDWEEKQTMAQIITQFYQTLTWAFSRQNFRSEDKSEEKNARALSTKVQTFIDKLPPFLIKEARTTG